MRARLFIGLLALAVVALALFGLSNTVDLSDGVAATVIEQDIGADLVAVTMTAPASDSIAVPISTAAIQTIDTNFDIVAFAIDGRSHAPSERQRAVDVDYDMPTYTLATERIALQLRI